MSGTNERLQTEVGSDAASTGWLDIDYAWLGQFVWAVVYKPFGAQSIGIYKMMMMIHGFMTVDETKGDLISEHTSLEKTKGLGHADKLLVRSLRICCWKSPIQGQ